MDTLCESPSRHDDCYATIEMDIRLLKPDPKNPRKRDRRSVAEIAKSIKEFGFVQPIVVDEHYTIVIGHGRLQAAKSMNFQTVPVIVMRDLSDSQRSRLQIADNRLSELSSWDDTLLSLRLDEILKFEPIEIPGFDSSELDNILGIPELSSAILEPLPTLEKTENCSEHHLLVSCYRTHEDKMQTLMSDLSQQTWCQLEYAAR